MGGGPDLASLAVPATGELIAVNDRYEPFRMTGPDGTRVEPVTEFFLDLLAAGRSEATVRSYRMDLLRRFRPGRPGSRGTVPISAMPAISAGGFSCPGGAGRVTRPRSGLTARRFCGAFTLITWSPGPGR